MHPDRDLLRRRPPAPRIVAFAAVATALAACLVLAALWWRPAEPTRGTEPKGQHFTTTLDGYERVALEDGSVEEIVPEARQVQDPVLAQPVPDRVVPGRVVVGARPR